MALAKSIALEYAAHGITANALAPDADRHRHARVACRDDFRRVDPRRPLRPAATRSPTLTVFLCSAHAGYITGEIVDINGGFLVD